MATTPAFGDVIQNITGINVASLDSVNVYGDPEFIVYGEKLTYEYESDEDDLKTYGQVAEKLTIPTKGVAVLEEGSLNWPALVAMTGFAINSGSGYEEMDALVGGEGMPYFGVIVSYASINGANMLAGFPKCKLTNMQSFNAEQNQFRVGELNFEFFAPSTVIRKLSRTRRYEVAESIPSTAAAFLAYFDGMFD